MYVVFWIVNRQLRATGLSTVILQTKIYCMQIQSPDDYNHSFAEAVPVIQLIVVVGRAMRSAIKGTNYSRTAMCHIYVNTQYISTKFGIHVRYVNST